MVAFDLRYSLELFYVYIHYTVLLMPNGVVYEIVVGHGASAIIAPF